MLAGNGLSSRATGRAVTACVSAEIWSILYALWRKPTSALQISTGGTGLWPRDFVIVDPAGFGLRFAQAIPA